MYIKAIDILEAISNSIPNDTKLVSIKWSWINKLTNKLMYSDQIEFTNDLDYYSFLYWVDFANSNGTVLKISNTSIDIINCSKFKSIFTKSNFNKALLNDIRFTQYNDISSTLALVDVAS